MMKLMISFLSIMVPREDPFCLGFLALLVASTRLDTVGRTLYGSAYFTRDAVPFVFLVKVARAFYIPGDSWRCSPGRVPLSRVLQAVGASRQASTQYCIRRPGREA